MSTTTAPRFTSTQHIGYGFLAAIVGAVLFVVGSNAVYLGGAGVIALVLVWTLAVVLVIGGQIYVVIGIAAKAIALGKRES